MILLYRLLPFFIGAFSLAGFVWLWWMRSVSVAAVGVAVALGLCIWLVHGGSKTPGRWALPVLPGIFLLSAFVSALFLQRSLTLILWGALVSVLLFLYNEHVFFYLHAPARYRAYALEYLSMLMALLSVFSVGTALFGLRMFLQTPIWLLCLLFVLFSGVMSRIAFWSGKFDARTVRWFGAAQALLLTEAFGVLLFLPTGFYTNAAILALIFYMTFGLLRAHLLQQLSLIVARRYLAVGGLLFLLICLSAQWI